MRTTLVRSEMALIVDLAADITLDHLSHVVDLFSALQRARQIEGISMASRCLLRCGLIIVKAIASDWGFSQSTRMNGISLRELLGQPGRRSAMLKGESQTGVAKREPRRNQCCGKLRLRRNNF